MGCCGRGRSESLAAAGAGARPPSAPAGLRPPRRGARMTWHMLETLIWLLLLALVMRFTVFI